MRLKGLILGLIILSAAKAFCAATPNVQGNNNTFTGMNTFTQTIQGNINGSAVSAGYAATSGSSTTPGYVIGMTGFTNLSTAKVTLAGAPATVYVPANVTTNTLTLPANMEIVPINGATVTINTGKTLSYSGSTSRWTNNAQVFAGSGTVTGLEQSKLTWFGPPSTDNSVSIQKWFNSSPILVADDGGTYIINTTITIPPNVKIKISNGTSFKLKNSTSIADSSPMFSLSGGTDTVIDGLVVDGNRANQDALNVRILGIKALSSSGKVTMRNLRLHDLSGTGMIVFNVAQLTLEDYTVEDCGRSGAELSVGATADRYGIIIGNDQHKNEAYYSIKTIVQRGRVLRSGFDGMQFEAQNSIIRDSEFSYNGYEYQTHDPGAGGLYVVAGQSATPNLLTENITIDHVTAIGNSGHGIDLGGSQAATDGRIMSGVVVTNCTASLNNYHGIAVSGQKVVVLGNRSYNNGKSAVKLGTGAANLRRSGISISSWGSTNTTDIVVSSNTVYDNQASPTQQYGIQIDNESYPGTTVSRLTIDNNNYFNNVIGSYWNQSAIPGLLGGDVFNAEYTALARGSTNGSTTATYTAQDIKWSKKGRIVTFAINVNYSGHTGTGNLQIVGLTFLPLNLSGKYPVTIESLSGVAYTGPTLTAAIDPATGRIQVLQMDTAGALTGVPIPAAANLVLTGSYITAE